MSYSNEVKARREAFERVPETCPYVDNALRMIQDAIEAEIDTSDSFTVAEKMIKDQTTAMRDAFIAAIEQAMEVEDEKTVLERELDEKDSEIADLRREIERLRAENRQMDDELAAMLDAA